MKKNTLKKIGIVGAISILIFTGYMYVKISINDSNRESTCFQLLANKIESGITPEEIAEADLSRLQYLVEYSLVARMQMLEVSNRLRVDKDAPIPSRDLLILKQGTEDYLSIREELLEIANSYECGLEVSDKTLEKYGIDEELKLKGLLVSLSAALTLYDNYLIGVVLFEQDARIRKLINDPDAGFGLVANLLNEMTLNANSIESRHRIRRVIEYYESSLDTLDFLGETEADFAYLNQLIASSPSYNYVKKFRATEIASKKFIAFERIAQDLISKSSDDGFDMVSGLFGNTMGLFESRKGKLYKNDSVKNHIIENLKPLDILLEKTPFRLTDKLIPGHFGHVAIWTGTKSELIELDLWNNPYVKKYKDKLSNSSDSKSKNEHQIIEALRSGVQLSTLEEFMNIDDFVILRPIFNENEGEELTKEALLMAFRQVGKKYDFNFDVNTTDKIVCSELAYVSFPSIDWPTEKTLGRHNISPDNVAKLAWNSLPLELVMFYHDGQLIPEETQLEKMKELMTN
ncbi:MAG: hypothetical protein BM563_01125 [Bacteroidetes bacterium MedPE-SWsnd-G1]|nr:MAG: hypothetical protein BM563_01125 [Bacteroidetes bacterium MedPE-SWsnd-G1]